MDHISQQPAATWCTLTVRHFDPTNPEHRPDATVGIRRADLLGIRNLRSAICFSGPVAQRLPFEAYSHGGRAVSTSNASDYTRPRGIRSRAANLNPMNATTWRIGETLTDSPWYVEM